MHLWDKRHIPSAKHLQVSVFPGCISETSATHCLLDIHGVCLPWVHLLDKCHTLSARHPQVSVFCGVVSETSATRCLYRLLNVHRCLSSVGASLRQTPCTVWKTSRVRLLWFCGCISMARWFHTFRGTLPSQPFGSQSHTKTSWVEMLNADWAKDDKQALDHEHTTSLREVNLITSGAIYTYIEVCLSFKYI